MAKLLLMQQGTHNFYAKGLAGNFAGTLSAKTDSGVLKFSDSNPGLGVGLGYQLDGRDISSVYVEVGYHRVIDNEGDPDSGFLSVGAGVLLFLNP